MPPSLKYQSDGGPGVGDIADLIARMSIEDRAINTERFFKGLAFNVLIGGTDAHAKNYSIVLIGARAQIAPLYDVASAAPYPQYQRLSSAMKVGEDWRMLDIGNGDWEKVGRRLGMDGGQAVAWVEQLRADLSDALNWAVASLSVDAQPEAARMAERIV